MDAVHPEVLERYCGVDGHERQRAPGQTGAGHPGDEDVDDGIEDPGAENSDSDDEDAASLFTDIVQRSIAKDQERNIRHDPIKVKRSQNPFTDKEQGLANLLMLLDSADHHRIIPVGYGVLEEEWGGEGYPETETIKFGRKRRELEVILPTEIWLGRAIRWAQALDIMVRLVDIESL